MTTFKVYSPDGEGALTVGASPLGKGGEGVVYKVEQHDCEFLPDTSTLVVKTYYNPEENDRKNKVMAMVKAVPNSDSVAWPLAIVVDSSNKFQGYIMPMLDTKSQKEWLYIANTKERREYAPDFNVRYALNTCLNLSLAVKSVHSAGHFLGDINESNAFVGADSSVTIVDTDSAQITSPDGEVFPCGVGKQEFLAPELIGHNLREVPRTEASDVFALGIMIFQMLTGGPHPTDGKFVGGSDVPSTASRISQGVYPTLRNESAKGFESVARIPSNAIPLKLQSALLRCFEVDPALRLTVDELIEVLEDIMGNITQCLVEPKHYYDKRDGDCGWCEHALTQNDPWGKKKEAPKIQQNTLPSLSFNEGSATPTSPPPRTAINGPTRSNPRRSGGNAAPSRPTSLASSAPSLSGYGASNRPTGLPYGGGNIPSSSNGLGKPSSTYLINSSTKSTPEPRPQVPSNLKSIPVKTGRKTTIVYPDNTYGARPPVRELAKSNKKLFLKSVFNETPGFMKFWWPKDRAMPEFAGLAIGLLLSYVILYGAFDVFNTYFNYSQAIGIFFDVVVLISAVFTSGLFGHALWLAIKRKDYAVKRENVFMTAVRFGLFSFAYLFAIPWWLFCLFYYYGESKSDE